jgi:hypothetical protein|tara:strand:+ start:257 stop:1081 length:825 start_codon:yes stop_codon:yes gene_type:complete
MKEVCLIILSHKSYQDIWDLTLTSYKKNFPKGIDVFLTSDKVKDKDLENLEIKHNITHLSYDEKLSWSGALRYIFNEFIHNKYKHVIFTFDDLVLTSKVHENKISDTLSYMKNDVDYLILNDGHRTLYSDLINLFKKEFAFKLNSADTYRGSLVFSAWKTSFFYKIINKDTFSDLNPWEYEQKINNALGLCNSFSLHKGIFQFANVIIKGKVLKMKQRTAEVKLNYAYNHNRKVLRGFEEFRFNMYSFIFKFSRYFLSPIIFKNIREIKKNITK